MDKQILSELQKLSAKTETTDWQIKQAMMPYDCIFTIF